MTASRGGQRPHERIDRSEPVVFSFNGGTVAGFAGDTIVSAVAAGGSLALGQSRRMQRRRGPLTADRFDPNCWLQVDDEPNVAAAHRLVRQGVRVRSQHVWPALGLDLKSANQRIGQMLRPSDDLKEASGAGFLRPIYRQLMARVDWREVGQRRRQPFCGPPAPRCAGRRRRRSRPGRSGVGGLVGAGDRARWRRITRSGAGWRSVLSWPSWTNLSPRPRRWRRRADQRGRHGTNQ